MFITVHIYKYFVSNHYPHQYIKYFWYPSRYSLDPLLKDDQCFES